MNLKKRKKGVYEKVETSTTQIFIYLSRWAVKSTLSKISELKKPCDQGVMRI